MQKKVLNLILVLCLLLGLFSFTTGTAAADSNAAYTEISTADELVALMGNPAGWSGNYRLTANIDLTGVAGQAPIGNYATAFTGIFDGNEKTISGIDITKSEQVGVGLFGLIMDAEIRNLTASGQVTVTGANFTGGIVGAITGDAVIENCTNNVTVRGVSRVGGVIGGIALNNGLYVTPEGAAANAETGSPAPSVGTTEGAVVMIKNCVNTGSVVGSSSRVGGIVGSASIGKTDGRHITVQGCTNSATLIKGTEAVGGIVGFTDPAEGTNSVKVISCTNTGKVQGTKATATLVGGIVGRTSLSTATTNQVTVEVTKCVNTGEVTAPAQLGGIVGYTYGKGTTISECLNTGSVTGTSTTSSASGGADAAGILGLANTATVENCINVGTISGTSNKNVGGIIGRTNSTNTVRNCYNAGATNGNGTNCRAICGGLAGTVTYTDNYYSAGSTDGKGTKVTLASTISGNAELFPEFAANEAWVITTAGPELAVFHEHSGDPCATCGYTETCAHTTTEIRVKTPATCVATGIGDKYCAALGCNTLLEENVVVPIDPNNHTSFVWNELGAGSFEHRCTACDTQLSTQSEAPAIYLSPANGLDTNDGLTAGTAVNTIDEAVARIANVGGTVYLLDRYVIGSNITLPAYTKLITFTTAPEQRNAAGSPLTGFVITAHGAVLSLGGPTKFENLIFNGSNPGKPNPSDYGHYNTPVIAGNWNNVEFGEKLVTYGNAYFVAGRNRPTTSDDTEKTVNITFARTTAQKVDVGNKNNTNVVNKAVTFFDRIMLGDRVNTTGITVSNKTVNATFNNTTVMSLWAGTTSSDVQNAQMINCSTTLNINDKAYINTIRSGDGNTGENGGTAYMDSLTVNLNENARVYGGFVPRNVRNMTLNISGNADGRDSLFIEKAFGPIALTDTYLASANYTGNETASITYGSHSFVAGVAAPAVSGYADGKVTINCIDECDWVDGDIITPAAFGVAGSMTKTCSVCGATKEEEIPAIGARLTQKSITAAKNTVSGESTMRFIASLEVADGATVTKIGTYISLVSFNEDGTPSTVGAKVAAKEQTISGAAPSTFALDLTGIPATDAETSIYAWAYADLSDGTRVVIAFDPASVSALLGAQQ